jgi:hypothetical protein
MIDLASGPGLSLRKAWLKDHFGLLEMPCLIGLGSGPRLGAAEGLGASFNPWSGPSRFA